MPLPPLDWFLLVPWLSLLCDVAGALVLGIWLLRLELSLLLPPAEPPQPLLLLRGMNTGRECWITGWLGTLCGCPTPMLPSLLFVSRVTGCGAYLTTG